MGPGMPGINRGSEMKLSKAEQAHIRRQARANKDNEAALCKRWDKRMEGLWAEVRALRVRIV